MTPEERLKDAREVRQKAMARLAELGVVIEHLPVAEAAPLHRTRDRLGQPGEHAGRRPGTTDASRQRRRPS
jgi:hypothetical protein